MANYLPTTADHIASSTGGYEPQRPNNFKLIVNGLPGGIGDSDIIFLGIENLEIPSDEDGVIVIRWGNESRKVSGDTEVSDMPMTLRDFVDAKVRRAFNDWRNLVYNPDTGVKGLASSYKKTGAIFLTSPDGVTFKRVAQCRGIWPRKRPGGSLTMNAGNNLVLLDCPLVCDRVTWLQS